MEFNSFIEPAVRTGLTLGSALLGSGSAFLLHTLRLPRFHAAHQQNEAAYQQAAQNHDAIANNPRTVGWLSVELEAGKTRKAAEQQKRETAEGVAAAHRNRKVASVMIGIASGAIGYYGPELFAQAANAANIVTPLIGAIMNRG